MSKNKETGLTDYSTFSELLSGPLAAVKEDNDYYYVVLEPETPYDNRAWRVSKKTQKPEEIHIFQFLEIEDQTTESDVDKLKRWVF
ncbi:MAG: hypothetical protein LUD48_01455 [Prevotella sp.]|nr:hypothetical protein [Prevotella sp.]